MIAYLICFTLTPVFTYLAQKNFKNNNKKLGIAFSILAIFVPTYICGIRRIGVGRDIDLYVEPTLKFARGLSFEAYMMTPKVNCIENGYTIFVYIFSRFSNDLNLLLFLIQLIPCFAVYYFAYKNREKFPMWLVMLVYLLVWYCRSFTVMRQSIAIGLVLIAIVKVKEKKYIQVCILMILAFYFHSSTLISLGMFAIIWINNKFEKRTKLMVYFVMIIILIIMTMLYQQILYYFTFNVKLLPNKFYNYLNNPDYALEKTNISITETVFRISCAMFGIIFFITVKDEEQRKDFMEYFMFLVIEWLLYIISFKITNAIRMGYYYYYIGLLYIMPSMIKTVKKDTFNKTISCMLIVGFVGIFWFIRFPIKKECETYPYKTDIITVLNKL